MMASNQVPEPNANGALADDSILAQSNDRAPNTGLKVHRVGAESIDDFNDVMMRGWGLKSRVLCDYNSHVLKQAPARNPLFLATLDGMPAGVASYFKFSKSVFMVGAVVLPEYRRQGIYRALVRARQQHALADGIQWATTHAMVESSAPLLESLGFTTVCRFRSYVNG